MRIRHSVFTAAVCICSALLLHAAVGAQAPAVSRAPAARAGEPAANRPHGSLLSVMRSVLFINANIIFAAQSEDPAALKLDEFVAQATNAPTGLYGQWMAVENAGIALAEAANLLTIPGRRCANGRPVPMQNADWPKFVEELRTAGMAASKAAQSKNQDAIVEVSEQLVEACAHCHEKYRDWPDMKEEMVNRCRADR
jgi:hypothetical protein